MLVLGGGRGGRGERGGEEEWRGGGEGVMIGGARGRRCGYVGGLFGVGIELLFGRDDS